MRERTNRTVSKTVVSQGTVGSNPTPSARVMSRDIGDQGLPIMESAGGRWWCRGTGGEGLFFRE